MTDIPLGSQVFDLAFHPSHATVYTGLLSGEVKATSYTHTGRYEAAFAVKVSSKSVRAISINADGSQLYAGGKGKSL
jgi:WD repeat-containing protein 55